VTEDPTTASDFYGISAAARLSGVGEQALRLYERKGLLTPARTDGGTRRYTDDDVTVLRRVAALLADGLNLTGARRVLELEADNDRLRLRIAELTD